MGTVAQSILKIRRLVHDEEATPIFSDDLIARLFWRSEAVFLVESRLAVGVSEIPAVPEWDFAATVLWEYQANGEDQRVFLLGEELYPFEVEVGGSVATGGLQFSSGFECNFVSSSPVKRVPYFLDSVSRAMIQTIYNGLALRMYEFKELDEMFTDAGITLGGDPTALALKDIAGREFYVDRIPTFDITGTYVDVGNELIDNGGFETFTGTADDTVTDAFRSWSVSSNTGYATATVNKNSGTYAVKLRRNGAGYCGVFQYVEVEPGKYYHISFYGSGSVDAYCVVEITNRLTGAAVFSDLSTVPMAAAFTKWDGWFQVPAGCTQIKVWIHNTGAVAGSAYLDDVSLVEVVTVDDQENFTVIQEEIVAEEGLTTDEAALYAPFVKYAEFRTASLLLAAETEKRNAMKAAHYQARYSLGVNLAKSIRAKLNAVQARVVGSTYQVKKGRRPWPRLPDHYPALRVR